MADFSSLVQQMKSNMDIKKVIVIGGRLEKSFNADMPNICANSTVIIIVHASSGQLSFYIVTFICKLYMYTVMEVFLQRC